MIEKPRSREIAPRRRFVVWGAALGMLATTQFSPLSAQQPIAVLLNGQPLNFGTTSPEQVDGRVLVPLREVFEALGATLDFDPRTMTVYAVRGETQIQLQLGSTQAYINNQPRTLDVPAQSRLGRTMVPLRFVSEALGAQVKWNNAEQTVTITAPDATGAIDTGYNSPAPVPTPGSPFVFPEKSVSGNVLKFDSTPPATITVRANGQVRTYTLAENARVFRQTTGAVRPNVQPVYSQPAPIAPTDIVPNSEVTLGLNEQDQVTQVVVQASRLVVRVRSAQGNRIVLDDAAGTELTIGNHIRFVDENGRPATTANIQPNQQVVLSIAPSSRVIYQISAAAQDIDAVNGTAYTAPGNTTPGNTAPDNTGTTTPTTPGTPAGNSSSANLPSGTPRIELVTHSAAQPLRNRDNVKVTARGTAGLKGTFSIGTKIQNQPLEETQPGVYQGTYTVQAGDDVLSGRVAVHLQGAGGLEDFQQSQDPITIDTTPPRIIDNSPTKGSTIAIAQPNITVYADDTGGSGIYRATMFITNNGETFEVQPTVAPPSVISAISPRPLSGQVSVKVNVADAARNSSSTIFTFFVQAAQGAITSVTHNATRALRAGEPLAVEMNAQPGGRATFDILNSANDQIVSQRIPMTEIAPGRYRGTYTVGDNIQASNVKIVGRFTDGANQTTTAQATTEAAIITATTAPLTISQPTDNQRVTSPVIIRGQAAPNALIDISLMAQGTRRIAVIFTREYQENLGTQQVRADANGNWATRAIELPDAPKNVSDYRFLVTATQIDESNRRSDPVTITITP